MYRIRAVLNSRSPCKHRLWHLGGLTAIREENNGAIDALLLSRVILLFFYWRIWESHLEFEYFTSAGRVAPLLFPGYTPLLSEYLKERLWPMPGTALIPGLHPAAHRVFKAEPLVLPQFRGRVKHADQQSHADAVEQQQARGSRRLQLKMETYVTFCLLLAPVLASVSCVCLFDLIDWFVCFDVFVNNLFTVRTKTVPTCYNVLKWSFNNTVLWLKRKGNKCCDKYNLT